MLIRRVSIIVRDRIVKIVRICGRNGGRERGEKKERNEGEKPVALAVPISEVLSVTSKTRGIRSRWFDVFYNIHSVLRFLLELSNKKSQRFRNLSKLITFEYRILEHPVYESCLQSRGERHSSQTHRNTFFLLLSLSFSLLLSFSFFVSCVAIIWRIYRMAVNLSMLD